MSDQPAVGPRLPKAVLRAWELTSSSPGWVRNASVAILLAAAAGVFMLMLIAPGRIISAQIPQDLWFMLDGAHRLVEGQVPNREFGTPIGPLTYYLLAAGYKITGNLGGMTPVATGLFTAALLPLLIYSVLSRLPAALALAIGIYILALTASPFFIGDLAPKPTHAMFYNRFGWAALSLLFLFLLPRRPSFGRDWADAAVMAALWLLLFYLKITYAAVGAVFLAAMLWFPGERRATMVAIALSAACLVVVELFWGHTANYLADVRSAVQATGAVRDGPVGLFASVLNNITGAYLLGALLLLALLNRGRWDYLLVCGYMAAAGIILDRHNSQGPGILTFIPAALAAILSPRSGRGGEASAAGRFPQPALTSVLMMGALVVPIAIPALGTLAFHALSARTPSPAEYNGTPLQGLIVSKPVTATRTEAQAALAAAAPNCGAIEPAPLLNAQRAPTMLDPAAVVPIAEDGARLLTQSPQLGGKVLALDVFNPFNALANRPSPAGGSSFMDADVSISETVHIPASRLFADVDVVMVPKIPLKFATFSLLERLYGDHIRANYRLSARSSCWDAYSRTTPRMAAARG
jgi:hypothetical protein